MEGPVLYLVGLPGGAARPPDPCSSPRTQQQSLDPRGGAPSCLLQWVPVSGVGWVRFSGAAKGMGLQADETPTLAPLWGCRSVGGRPLKGGAPAVPSRQASTPHTQPTSTATRHCLNGCSRYGLWREGAGDAGSLGQCEVQQGPGPPSLQGVQKKRPSDVQSALLRRHLLELTQSFIIPLVRHGARGEGAGGEWSWGRWDGGG